MTDTIEPVVLDEDEKQVLAQRLVDQAKAEGVVLRQRSCRISGFGSDHTVGVWLTRE